MSALTTKVEQLENAIGKVDDVAMGGEDAEVAVDASPATTRGMCV